MENNIFEEISNRCAEMDCIKCPFIFKAEWKNHPDNNGCTWMMKKPYEWSIDFITEQFEKMKERK